MLRAWVALVSRFILSVITLVRSGSVGQLIDVMRKFIEACRKARDYHGAMYGTFSCANKRNCVRYWLPKDVQFYVDWMRAYW